MTTVQVKLRQLKKAACWARYITNCTTSAKCSKSRHRYTFRLSIGTLVPTAYMVPHLLTIRHCNYAKAK